MDKDYEQIGASEHYEYSNNKNDYSFIDCSLLTYNVIRTTNRTS